MVPDRVYILNLPCKPERRIRLETQLSELALFPPDRIRWVRALSGDLSPGPDWWTSGDGAWGCLMSHIQVVHSAIMDGLENYLVLEDDAIFHPRAGEMLERLFAEVPADWDQVYLGGQHLSEPRKLPGRPFVLRATNVNRTHAFMLRKKAYARFQQHVLHAPDYIARPGSHIDHQLGLAHERQDWNVYCPAWWLCGQDSGSSNISGRQTRRMWWQPRMYSRQLPFVLVEGGRDCTVPGEIGERLHFGHNLRADSLEDAGLSEALRSDESFRTWLDMIAGEAMDEGKLPALQHPEVGPDRVRRLWPAGVHSLDDAPIKGWIGYPWKGLLKHPLNETDRAIVGQEAPAACPAPAPRPVDQWVA